MLKENLIRIYEKSFRDNHARMALSDYLTKENYSYLEMAQEIAKLHLLFYIFSANCIKSTLASSFPLSEIERIITNGTSFI